MLGEIWLMRKDADSVTPEKNLEQNNNKVRTLLLLLRRLQARVDQVAHVQAVRRHAADARLAAASPGKQVS
jgi:hypothetical protein